MNKNSYKVIFSRIKNEMIAVSEISSSIANNNSSNKDKVISSEKTSSSIFTLKISNLFFAIMVSFGLVSINQAFANNSTIIEDTNAPYNNRSNIMQTANGLPQVDIATPNEQGLSHNKFKQFDVGSQGAIVNNSQKNTQTQMAGFVQANPNLLGKEASTILNEVNNPHASQLNGFVEIAGKRADIIIANPSGINVSGGGFINASRAQLTTGQVNIEGGKVSGFDVNKGQIEISGKGMNNSASDYTDIISKTAKINAAIHPGKELNIITGKNKVSTDTKKVTANNQETNNSNQEANYAIDVSNLGGMYTGKIRLVGTEKGMGVKNAGQIFANAEDITIDVNGNVVNSGSILAQNKTNPIKIDIKAKDIENTGTISSTGKQNLNGTKISNQGVIVTSNELKINSQTEINNKKGNIKAARLELNAKLVDNTDGKILQTGMQKLKVESKDLINTKGEFGTSVVSADNNSDSNDKPSNNKSNDKGQIKDIPSTAKTDSKASFNEYKPDYFADGIIKTDKIINEQGSILANGIVDADLKGDLINDNASFNVSALNLMADKFSNKQGKLTANTADIKVKQVDNNQGGLNIVNDLNLNSKDSIDNTKGIITAKNQVIKSAKLINKEGKLQTTENIDLDIKDDIDSTKGQIVSNNNIEIKVANLNSNEGLIQAKGKLNFQVKDKINNNQGKIIANDTDIKAKELTNEQQGEILATNKLNVNIEDNIDSTKGKISGKYIEIQTNNLINQEGKINSISDTKIKANIINNKQGSISSNQKQTIQGLNNSHVNSLINDDGVIEAGDTNNLKISDFNNKGKILSNNLAKLDVKGNYLENGEILAKILEITTNNLENNKIIKATDKLTINTDNLKNNQIGEINANNETHLLVKDKLIN